MNLIADIINKILLGNTKLAGLRTIIINALVLVLGMWEFLTKEGGVFEYLCSVSEAVGILSIFCGISETVFYVTAVTVMASLNIVLRFLTSTPAGVEPAQAQIRIYEANTGKMMFSLYMFYAAVAAILFLLIRAIVINA